MSNARKLADNLPTEGNLTGRNMVINGDMKINQRGFSSENTDNNFYAADRWRVLSSNTGNTFTTQISDDVPPQHEFGNSILTTCNEGVSLNNWDHETSLYYHYIGQYIEHET